MPAWRRLDSESLREELRTNLWFVPLVEVVVALALFVITYALDRAAFDGAFRLPSWALSGSADAARQILTTVAAAIITVVGVVFSIVIVALTLTSTQFGPRMLRNFIRDQVPRSPWAPSSARSCTRCWPLARSAKRAAATSSPTSRSR